VTTVITTAVERDSGGDNIYVFEFAVVEGADFWEFCGIRADTS